MDGILGSPPDTHLKPRTTRFQVAVRFVHDYRQLYSRTGEPVRILVVQDEPLLADAFAVHLARAGHAVDCVGRLDDADVGAAAIETVRGLGDRLGV